MEPALIISSLLIGLGGTLHCIFMCGPLALALPIGKKPKSKAINYRLIFIAGRIFVYVLMGALVGLVGQSISWIGGQKVWLFGLLVLLFFIFSGWNFDLFKKIRAVIQQRFVERLGLFPLGGFFLLGIGNGLIPCGLVYVALAQSSIGSAWFTGAFLMLIFGLANSWWHILFMLNIGFQIPDWYIFKLFSSPRISIAMVTLVLFWRFFAISQSEIVKSNNQTKSEVLCGSH